MAVEGYRACRLEKPREIRGSWVSVYSYLLTNSQSLHRYVEYYPASSYCDPSCLFVCVFVRSFVNIQPTAAVSVRRASINMACRCVGLAEVESYTSALCRLCL